MSTTSRNRRNKEKRIKINCKKGTRAKVTRVNLFHVLTHQEQKEMLHQFRNSRNFYGTMLNGSRKQAHYMKFDEVPANHK